MTEDAIVIRNLSYGYGNDSSNVLRDINLAVRPGSCVGIVGPSGCGKSTLLSLLSGLVKFTAGELQVRRSDPGRQTLTMMFQKDTLLPWLTVLQNIKLYYRIRGGGKKPEVEAFVEELLTLGKLGQFRNFFPYQLSGGMRRRVAFLSSVAPRPEILLLDEPFSSLDEPTRVAIHQDVFRIMRRNKMTVILVTHDISEAVSLCDEVVVLTSRPGTVFSRRSIPFGEERDMLQLRKTSDFLRIYGELWEELSAQIVESQKTCIDGSSHLGAVAQ